MSNGEASRFCPLISQVTRVDQEWKAQSCWTMYFLMTVEVWSSPCWSLSGYENGDPSSQGLST